MTEYVCTLGVLATAKLDLYFRAHTAPLEAVVNERKQQSKPQDSTRPQSRNHWQEHALMFHTVPTADEAQKPVMGAYICAQLESAKYVAKELGLFCPECNSSDLRVLRRFVRASVYEPGTLEEFRQKVFLKYLKAGAMITGYDMPVQISRIAIAWNPSQKWRRAFSFYFRVFRDKKRKKLRPSEFEPGLSIQSLDAAKAIYRLIKYKSPERKRAEEEEQSSRPCILDLKTLTSVLTGEVYSLATACETFGAPSSRKRNLHPRMTKPMIEHLLRTLTGELELLNRLKDKFDSHTLAIAPEHCFSPATVAKDCFRR